MIYFDWAATALPDEDILTIQKNTAFKFWGNPSAITEPGRQAAKLLNESRESIAQTMGCGPYQIIFTSGGTESNNLIIGSMLLKEQPGEIIAGLSEHPSVYDPLLQLQNKGWKIHFLKPDRMTGQITAEMISQKMSTQTKMVCLMGLNNETGAINPIKDISRFLTEYNATTGRTVHFHCDMVQTLGKIPVNLKDSGIDSASFSGHKISAPRGIGVLYIRRKTEPLFRGGGQEQGIRPGTENTSGAHAFCHALDNSNVFNKNHREINSLIVDYISSQKDIEIVPKSRQNHPENFSDSILNLSCSSIPAEVLTRTLSEENVYVSTGSACSSKKQNKTRVLESFGVDRKKAFSSIRLSFGSSTTVEEAKTFCNILRLTVDRFNRDLNL